MHSSCGGREGKGRGHSWNYYSGGAHLPSDNSNYGRQIERGGERKRKRERERWRQENESECHEHRSKERSLEVRRVAEQKWAQPSECLLKINQNNSWNEKWMKTHLSSFRITSQICKQLEWKSITRTSRNHQLIYLIEGISRAQPKRLFGISLQWNSYIRLYERITNQNSFVCSQIRWNEKDRRVALFNIRILT